MCGCLSWVPTGDLACNPGMCPDWEPNQGPFDSQPVLGPELYQTGNISCNTDMVVINSFSFFLSGKFFTHSSNLNNSFAGQSNIGCRFLLSINLHISCKSFSTVKFPLRNQLTSLMEASLQVTNCFSDSVFVFNLGILIYLLIYLLLFYYSCHSCSNFSTFALLHLAHPQRLLILFSLYFFILLSDGCFLLCYFPNLLLDPLLHLLHY